MPFFGLFWVTSWVSGLFGYSQGLFGVPNYLTSALPARVLSVVGSPLESYNPLVIRAVGASMPDRNSDVRGYKNSLAVPTLGLQVGSVRRQSLPKQVPSPVRVPQKLNAVEKLFCGAESEQKDDSQLLASTLPPLSVSRVEESSRVESKPSLPQKIIRVMQNLFRRPDRDRLEGSVNSKPKPVVVVRTGKEDEVSTAAESDLPVAKRGFWLYSQMLSGRAEKVSIPPKEKWSQVWVKGRLMAQIPDRLQAESIAQNMERLLNNPNLDASQLQPALVDEKPVGKLGDRVLFAIDSTIAKQLNRNAQLVAIEWVNNLRIAFNKEPLTLVQAQSRMYGLVETEKRIEGLASWYGGYFHGRLTANGETYNQYALTAAHPSLPFNTYLKVTNKINGKSAIVRVNDRGPYIPPRSLDLSLAAARCIKSEEKGVVPYSAIVMQPLSTP